MGSTISLIQSGKEKSKPNLDQILAHFKTCGEDIEPLVNIGDSKMQLEMKISEVQQWQVNAKEELSGKIIPQRLHQLLNEAICSFLEIDELELLINKKISDTLHKKHTALRFYC